MKFNNHHLAQLFAAKKAVVFCGAGISLEPPAGLPDWHSLRDFTLKAICSRDSFFGKYLPQLTQIEMISSPEKQGLTPEVVASQIMRHSKGYFESFKALNRGMPNVNHRYLALLAKNSHMPFIVTTNFDLFIEQAFDEENVDYHVCISEKDFDDVDYSSSTVHLIKLHGCITQPQTITTTVEQQAKGLSPQKARVLEKLLMDYHFVFWGYSGADLKIDLDYLRMITTKESAVGFTWNFLQREDHQEKVNPHVHELAKIYDEKAQVVHGKLPEIFHLIIDPQDQIVATSYTYEEEQQRIAEKNRKLEKALQRWAKKYVTPIQACRILGALLQHSGNMESAIEIYQHRAEKLEVKKNNPRSRAIAYNQIGSIYRQQGDYEDALYYFKKAMELDKKSGNSRGLSIDLNNIANVYKETKRYEEALEYYQQAGELRAPEANNRTQGISLRNIGKVYQLMENFTKAEKLFRESLDMTIESRNKKGQAISYYHLGNLYEKWQKFDKAINYYSRAKDLNNALGDKKGLCIVLSALGDTYKAQNNYEKSLEYYQISQKTNLSLGNRKGLATDARRIASIYQLQKSWENSLVHWKKAEELYHHLRDKSGLLDVFKNLKEVYSHLENKERQEYYAQKEQELMNYLQLT